MARVTIKKIYVSKPEYNGGRPDFYRVKGGGNVVQVSSKERALEIANARRRLILKRGRR